MTDKGAVYTDAVLLRARELAAQYRLALRKLPLKDGMMDGHADEDKLLIDTILAALQDRAGVGEGFRVVPAKPTEEMLEAGEQCMTGEYYEAKHVWEDMIAAAPASPGGRDAVTGTDLTNLRAAAYKRGLEDAAKVADKWAAGRRDDCCHAYAAIVAIVATDIRALGIGVGE